MSNSPRLQIYIADVTNDDWQKLYQFLNKTEAYINLSINDRVMSVQDTKHILDETGHPLQLEITLGDINLQTLISSPDAIRIRFNPDTLKSIAQRKVIMRLMSTLSRRLRKQALLTLADDDEIVLCKYSLDTGWLLNPSVDKLIGATSRLKWYLDDLKHHLKSMFK